MVFSSLAFLCIFLPVVFLLYVLLPGTRAKNGLLVVVSLLFYAYGEPVYIILLVISAALNWLFGQLIGARKTPKRSLQQSIITTYCCLIVLRRIVSTQGDQL